MADRGRHVIGSLYRRGLAWIAVALVVTQLTLLAHAVGHALQGDTGTCASCALADGGHDSIPASPPTRILHAIDIHDGLDTFWDFQPPSTPAFAARAPPCPA
jgi:hypothetical protein